MKLYLCAVFLLSGCIAKFVEEIYETPELFFEDDKAMEDLGITLLEHDLDGHNLNYGKHEHDTSDLDMTFSVYLEKQITVAGEHQHLKFDKILENDKDVYSPNTGVFRAPRCGVYWFTYTIAAKGSTVAKAHLMIEKRLINTAISTPRYGTHQGSNSAFIHMHKGEEARIELSKGSSLAVEDVLNTFSGSLVYTRE